MSFAFLTSKADKIEATAAHIVAFARNLPGQILQKKVILNFGRDVTDTSAMLTSYPIHKLNSREDPRRMLHRNGETVQDGRFLGWDRPQDREAWT